MIRAIVAAGLSILSLGVKDVQATCIDRRAVIYRIAKQEGYWRQDSLPQRQNNPCSLIFTNQRGATRGSKGFARFTTPLKGFEACEMDVSKKLRAGIKLHKGWSYL